MSVFLRRLRLALNLFFWLNRIYSYQIKLRFSACGLRFQSGYPLKVTGARNIKVGNNFSSMGSDYLYANEGKLIIGDNCSINTNVQIGASGGLIVIGDNVMIAPNVVIRAANHGFGRDTEMRFQPHTYGEIHIEDDVWIGSNAVITSGVRLAKGTVVGAGAVVTKSTEPYSMVGGVPARRIGERI
jgi:galactoside O-acetyltransferase